MPDQLSRVRAALADRYAVEQEIGSGGMATVYLAEDPKHQRKVAVKVLRPELATALGPDRFLHEIQVAARLQHPNILPLLDSGDADGLLYYVMPYVEGPSLRERLANQGELPVHDAVKILTEVVDALAEAHERGIVHRDVKPDNVLLTGRHAVVTDFGVAKAVNEATGRQQLTTAGVALGTPAYMAPEQAAADPNIDGRVDIYAVGAVAYEMLTGRPPFTGATSQAVLAAHMSEEPRPLRQHRASIPAALEEIVLKCLAKHPADRFQSAEELLPLLEPFRTPSGGVTPTDTKPVRFGAPAPSRSARYGIAAAVVVALAAVGLFATRIGGGPGAMPLDPDVVAVLPFRVAGADPSLHYLREGMMDLLAAKFTGEGGPRAADPRTVANAWRGAGASETKDLSQPAAIDLARGLGAGQLLLGGIVGSPGRVVLNATLLAVPDGETQAQITVEGPADSLPALIDRLAGRLLLESTVASVQASASLTTTSLDALKAYLAGQAAYRDGDYQEAADHYTRAIEVDSTFALAAFALRVALGWGARGDRERAGRLAWAGRDQMSRRDRTLMEAYMGPDYPEASSEAEMLAARERAVALAPDHPDAWYFLGDQYFHQGEFLGYTDWMDRAAAGFERALALDSSFAGPVSHMVDIAFGKRDTAMMRRYADRFMTTEGAASGGYSLVVRYRIAELLGDSARMAEVRASYDTMPTRPAYLPHFAVAWGSGSFELADELFGVLARRASTREERQAYFAIRTFDLFDRGRPRAALARLDSLARLGESAVGPAYIRTMASLYWTLDSTAGAEGARRLASVVSAPPGETADARIDQYGAACALGHWRIAQGQLADVPALIRRLENVPEDDPFTHRSTAHTCAVILQAMLAVARRSPDAHRLVARADSFMLRGPPVAEVAPGVAWFPVPYENLVIARLYGTLGDPEAGLAAARRMGYFGGRMVTYLREQGRLAALAGDREAALEAYAELLRWWSDVEPSMEDDVQAVRAEVERLTREGG